MLSRWKRLRQIAIVLLVAWFILLVPAINWALVQAHKTSPDLPFGVSVAKSSVHVLDFTYNWMFLEGISRKIVAHPYRMEDQAALVQHLAPQFPSGMPYGYSPVTMILEAPLLWLPSHGAFLVFLFTNVILTLVLFRNYLLPRAGHLLQWMALLVCFLSIWDVTGLLLGQTVFLTTALFAGMWSLLVRRPLSPTLSFDALIAVFFWALCLKPSVAIVPAMLLLGAFAWRPLLLGTGFLLATWTLLSGYYGGWISGLEDYAYLLGHYSDGAAIPFLQRHHLDAAATQRELFEFDLRRDLLLLLNLVLLWSRWTRRIDASEHFRGAIWSFLLLSPYLMGTEKLVLCLVVVEGTFFASGNFALHALKLLLWAALFNLEAGITWPPGPEVDYFLEWALFLWGLAEWISIRKSAPEQRVNAQT